MSPRSIGSILLLGALGCSASPSDSDAGGSPATGGAGGTSSVGGSGGVGGVGGQGGSAMAFMDGGAGGTGGEGGILECESLTVAGEKVPLDLVIVQDRSGSMVGERWEAAVDAIKAFADNPGAAGLNVGLTYFPPKLGNECTPSVYANMDVDIAPLPGNAYAIKESLLETAPSGGTPMRPALEGGIDALEAWLSANPTHEGVVILVTDGDPGGCTNNTASSVAQTAEDAFTSSPSIRTFVVGMTGANFSNLENIAEAGGTDEAFDVGSGTSAFVAALESIRQQAISCEYLLPIPAPSEGTLDFDSVSVEYVPGLNEPAEEVSRVDGPGDCGELSGGFYYDDNDEPQRIVLCPASCDLVQSGTENAEVRVVLGCILPPPE